MLNHKHRHYFVSVAREGGILCHIGFLDDLITHALDAGCGLVGCLEVYGEAKSDPPMLINCVRINAPGISFEF